MRPSNQCIVSYGHDVILIQVLLALKPLCIWYTNLHTVFTLEMGLQPNKNFCAKKFGQYLRIPWGCLWQDEIVVNCCPTR